MIQELDFLRIYRDNWPVMGDIDIDGDSSRLTTTRSNDRYYQANPRDLLGREVFMPVTLGGVFIPIAWITIRQSKNMVVTPVTEQRGAVIELISHTAFNITLKGLLYNTDGTIPEEQIQDLLEVAELNESVEINNALTDLFLLTPENNGVPLVVIKDFNLLDGRGKTGVRPFEMNLISDHNLELTIT